MVVVSTDKPNSYGVVSKVNYKLWVENDLRKIAEAILRHEVLKTDNLAEVLIKDLWGDLLKEEEGFLCEWIASQAISKPFFLVKDHKDRDKQGYFPTKL
eukprot:1743539-Ditylum_brightwellii.AAC.1